MEFRRLPISKLGRAASGVDSRTPESFGCLDVADPGDPVLVHEERLDGATGGAEQGGKPLRGESRPEWFRPEPGESLVVQGQAYREVAEAPLVRKDHPAIAGDPKHRADGRRVRLTGMTQSPLAAHAEMAEQCGAPTGQFDPQELAPPPDRRDDLPLGRRPNGALGLTPPGERIGNRDLEQVLPGEPGSQVFPVGFGFGQLRHAVVRGACRERDYPPFTISLTARWASSMAAWVYA